MKWGVKCFPVSNTGKRKASKYLNGRASLSRKESELLWKTGSNVGLTVEVDEPGYNYEVDDADLPSTAVNTANTDGSELLDYADSSLSMGASILSGIKSGQTKREYFPPLH